jgi:hypothetical protein
MANLSNLLEDVTDHDPVRRHTSARVLARLDRRRRRETSAAIAKGPAAIRARLAELDREWNVDRALMMAFATLGTAAHELEHRVDRRFGWILRAQILFLGVHSVVGWCPPVPVLRRLGFRTQREIDGERFELELALGRVEPSWGAAPGAPTS